MRSNQAQFFESAKAMQVMIVENVHYTGLDRVFPSTGGLVGDRSFSFNTICMPSQAGN